MPVDAFSRRTFLRGVGITMALPWLESRAVWGDAPAQAALRAVRTRGREGIGAVTHGGLTNLEPSSVHPAGWPRGGEVLIMPAFPVSEALPQG